jgi:hypothetical protein
MRGVVRLAGFKPDFLTHPPSFVGGPGRKPGSKSEIERDSRDFVHGIQRAASQPAGTKNAQSPVRVAPGGRSHVGLALLADLIATAGLPLYEEIIEERAALQPPPKEQAEWQAIISRYEKALAEAEVDPAKQIASDSFLPVRDAVEKLGVKNCTL